MRDSRTRILPARNFKTEAAVKTDRVRLRAQYSVGTPLLHRRVDLFPQQRGANAFATPRCLRMAQPESRMDSLRHQTHPQGCLEALSCIIE